MTFELLAKNIEAIHSVLQQQAAHAVNLSLTSRNWLMGCYIVEFEQNGKEVLMRTDIQPERIRSRMERIVRNMVLNCSNVSKNACTPKA